MLKIKENTFYFKKLTLPFNITEFNATNTKVVNFF